MPSPDSAETSSFRNNFAMNVCRMFALLTLSRTFFELGQRFRPIVAQ